MSQPWSLLCADVASKVRLSLCHAVSELSVWYGTSGQQKIMFYSICICSWKGMCEVPWKALFSLFILWLIVPQMAVTFVIQMLYISCEAGTGFVYVIYMNFMFWRVNASCVSQLSYWTTYKYFYVTWSTNVMLYPYLTSWNNYIFCIKFEIFVVANIYVMVFCVMAACSLVGAYQHFGTKYCLHLEAIL
jgi:hypothetical protein